MACINQKCKDPCIGACGSSSICRVQNHLANCECPPGYTGNSFEGCVRVIEPVLPQEPIDPCSNLECGSNAYCENGQCRCRPDTQGDPYSYQGCRPECVISAECSPNKACIRNKCVDPCNGICGERAICETINHGTLI